VPTGADLKSWRVRVDSEAVIGRHLPRGRHLHVLLAATALFAAIFLGRLADTSGTSGLTVLYVLPVVLVGVELGRLAGIVAGLVALGLFAAGMPFAPSSVAPFAYLARGASFAIVGAVAGHLADRLRALGEHAQISARHFELARDLFCTASFDGYLTQVNGAWERCLGWTREELMSRPFVEFVHPDDRAATVQEAAQATRHGRSATFTNRYRTKDGEWRWIEWSTQTDPERQVIYAAARDVTERKHAEERLRYLADHDSLSGVYNRRRFEQELTRELEHSRRRGSRGAVLVLDVDGFKAINDSLGHGTGDEVIVRLGATLTERLRTGDVVARLGGDEFAVLLRRVDPATARELVGDVRRLATADLAELVRRPVTLSLGVAPFGPGQGMTVDELLSRADHAMYAAKRAGGDQLAVAGEDAQAARSAEPVRSASAGG
jgi:diguanylate cyclase (GGDEF)-like protein/PAS domain S-box-containing protein